MISSGPPIATILPPLEGFGPGRVGAVGSIVHALARTPGFQCIVYGGPQPAAFDVPFRAVRPARWFPGNVNLRFGAALLGPLRRLRPALVEVHNRPELARFLAVTLRRPVLLFLHNDPQRLRGLRSPAGRVAMLRRMARVVAVSGWVRDRMLEGVAAPARSPVVLPNCLDLAALPAPQPRENLILFVGRVVPEKAPDVFVAACAAALPRLPGWRAEIVGADRFRPDSPDTGFIRGIRAAAEAAGVQLAGYRDRDAVLAAMARAAIVAMPSRWQEPFGLVALEAMASGAALVCAPRGGLPEVAGAAALYADPDQPGALAEAILALAADPARRTALGEAGRQRAQAFDVSIVRAQLAALRRAVLAEAEGR
jgi:glycosyltransferase involved in cell wall biosynthesis